MTYTFDFGALYLFISFLSLFYYLITIDFIQIYDPMAKVKMCIKNVFLVHKMRPQNNPILKHVLVFYFGLLLRLL